jgi:hypothetical protein
MDAISGSDPHHWENHVTDHGDGATVTFYRDGKPVPVDVEKSVPVGPEGTPAGATTSDGSTFGPLVEKAYAKEFTFNQYERLDAGVWPHETLEAMTGLPGHTATAAIGVDRIRELLADGRPVCAGSRPWDSLSEKARAERGYGPGGLPIPDGAHAYTITKVDEEGNVSLHNPWGHSHVQVSKQQFARQFFYVGWC